MKKFYPLLTGLLLGLLCTPTFNLYSQEKEGEDELYNMDLAELMEVKIDVASKKALTPRESPGIVSLITSEEITKSGARDLIDVLNLVPGLQFGTDVQGVVSLISRGNWGHEGKILVLLDGMMMNEIWYATPQFGNHFPVDLIDRIEIIRGPGSSIYGGYAELGVINIITKKGDKLDGGLISVTNGEMATEFGRRNVSMAFGKKINDFSFTSSLFVGQGNQSDQDFTDFYDDTFNMGNGNSKVNPMMLNMNMKYKGLTFKFLADEYKMSNATIYFVNTPDSVGGIENNFLNYQADLSYDFEINERFTLTPKINYIRQHPWLVKEEKSKYIDVMEPGYYGGVYADFKAERLTNALIASYDISNDINLLAGAEYYTDYGEDYSIGTIDTTTGNLVPVTFSNGKKTVEYENMSAFLQGFMKTRLVNITAGLRFENHSAIGNSFVPRFALTRSWDNFHVKALFSQAFRAPSIANINFNPGIKPETTQVLEIEGGFRPANKMYITINLFDNIIHDPIVYFYDVETENDGYKNGEKVNTRGVETEYKYRSKWGYATVNYSYYMLNENTVADYGIPKEGEYLEPGFSNNQLLKDDMLLGSAQHKVSLLGSFRATENLSLNPSLTSFSERYGFTHVDDDDVTIAEKFDPAILLNFNMEYRDLLTKGLALNVAVFDILDEKFHYIQPYNQYHAPLPATTTEFVVRLRYKF